jgi:hypothetical protein
VARQCLFVGRALSFYNEKIVALYGVVIWSIVTVMRWIHTSAERTLASPAEKIDPPLEWDLNERH